MSLLASPAFGTSVSEWGQDPAVQVWVVVAQGLEVQVSAVVAPAVQVSVQAQASAMQEWALEVQV
jgi:hypothetical protein